MHEREERDARGIRAQRPQSHADTLEAVPASRRFSSKSFQPPSGPTASKTSFFVIFPHRALCDNFPSQPRGRWIGGQAKRGPGQAVEVILDKLTLKRR